jgi:hypothetical protein
MEGPTYLPLGLSLLQGKILKSIPTCQWMCFDMARLGAKLIAVEYLKPLPPGILRSRN